MLNGNFNDKALELIFVQGPFFFFFDRAKPKDFLILDSSFPGDSTNPLESLVLIFHKGLHLKISQCYGLKKRSFEYKGFLLAS